MAGGRQPPQGVLDRLLIFGRPQLEHVLRVYIRHFTSNVHTERSNCDARIITAEPILRPQRSSTRLRSDDATSSADSSTNTRPRRAYAELLATTIRDELLAVLEYAP